MKIYYHVATEKCPICGKILKKENDGWLHILMILTFVVSVPIMFAREIIYERILKFPDIPKVVNEHKMCPRCKTLIRMNNCYTLDELTKIQSFNYNFRWWLRISYFLGGIVIFMAFMLALVLLVAPYDILGLMLWSIPICGVCIAIIAAIVYAYKRKLNDLKNEVV